MMATKERNFTPLPNLSLEELVPKDNFYRRLEATLDLSFVRELVRDCYASSGRPSVDPVVFFRLQLVMFFEDIRSERQLMEVVADRLSIRWYLGYDLDEPLPDHSSLTKIRDFAPLPNLSLEELVPKDNFYRRLEATLDLSFVRELVLGTATLLRDAPASTR